MKLKGSTHRSLFALRRRYLAHFQLRRNMSTGLFLVSAKALNSQPTAPSALAISSYAGHNGQCLRVYDLLQYKAGEDPPGIVLSVVRDLSTTRREGFQKLEPLPPLATDKLDDVSALERESIKVPPRYEPSDPDDVSLPSELQPKAMPSGLPEANPEDMIQDFDKDAEDAWGDLEDLADQKQCPDFDPNIPKDAIDDQDMVKHTMSSYDAVDMKNCDYWSSDQDLEANCFTRDIHGWLKADVEECTRGAQPRLYQRLNISIKPVKNVIISEDYDPSPLSCKLTNLRAPPLTSYLAPSDLSPYILTYQIPCPPHVNTTDRDEKFRIIFERFAYLISHKHFRRISCFKREEGSSLPQWLVTSEFTELPTSSWWLTLKKQEAEYWWRKNGWEGVLIEFFRLRQPR